MPNYSIKLWGEPVLNIDKTRVYISTVDQNARRVAQSSGAGIEIAEYCTAWNMDMYFDKTDAAVTACIDGIENKVLHAPFNELFPCAIDPEARKLAARRYKEAIALAQRYGAHKVVIHSGYAPNFYYDIWFEEQSIVFWKEFAACIPEGITVCIENVLETEPEPLLHIVEALDNEKIRLCFDIGHANAYSKTPVMQWLERFAPYISHFHIHNNSGEYDAHDHLTEGTIPMRELLIRAEELCPNATYTLEITDSREDVNWLLG